MLACCAEPPPPPPPVTAAVQPPELPAPKAPVRALPHPARKPTPPPAAESPAPEGPAPEAHDEALAMIAPEPAGPGPSSPVAAPPQPKELIGLDQPAATHLFGNATERTEEPPATIWRYKTATCELDLFFYLDLRSGRMRTLHYAFKGDDGESAGRENCLREIVAARRT
jgi:outer membrane biosynthesis protein TonB